MEADLVLQNFFHKLLYLLLISNESVNTSVDYYSSRPMLSYFFILRTHLSFPDTCSLLPQKYSSEVFKYLEVFKFLSL